jgi:hypothetical protein
MARLRITSLCLLGLFISSGLTAAELLWPLAKNPLAAGQSYPSFVQPTASGEPESALFGCIRTNGKRFHEAIDIAPVDQRRRGEATDPVLAVHDGVVRHISLLSGNSSYGRYVVLEHPGLNLQIYSLYAHLSKVEPGLAVGQVVKAGDPLGIMGRSAGGYTIPRSRAHLHLEVGLRLSDSFEEWYRRQAYPNPNQHGSFNGMNLIGWDPLDYYQAWQAGRVDSPLEYIEQIKPAAMVHVLTDRQPDFVKRYPELVLPGCDPSHQAGWEVLLSPWGLPLSLKALTADELKGVNRPGDISVVGVDTTALDRFACRRIIKEQNGKVTLGSGGKTIMELLFMPDPRD